MTGDLPLVPFIDVLLCLISFLLITAVWTEMARLEASASVPRSGPDERPDPDSVTLHVVVGPERCGVEWRRGNEVVDAEDVVFDGRPSGGRALGEAVARGLGKYSAGASRPMTAVLHTSDAIEFATLAAALDALHGVRHPDGPPDPGSAFQVVLAAR